MKKCLYFTFCLLALFACTTEQKNKPETLSKEQITNMDSLMNRYLALGRFSGSVLIQKAGNTLYQQYFGLANYENQITFTSKNRFKISKAALVKAGLITRRSTASTSEKHLATGYLFYNYQGQGMEWKSLGR
jgi:hypothetical protein